jgi:hypothetical protein
VLGGTGVWLSVATRNLDRVEVSWTGPLTCTGAEVVHHRPGGEGPRVQAMRMRQTMDCILPVRIDNHSRLMVHVNRVVLPYMGPGGGGAARVEELGGQPPLGAASRRQGRIDAVFPQNRQLEPGEHLAFDVRFTFRPSGCDSPRAVTTVGPMPRVVVSSLGRTATRDTGKIAFVGTEDSSCDT